MGGVKKLIATSMLVGLLIISVRQFRAEERVTVDKGSLGSVHQPERGSSQPRSAGAGVGPKVSLTEVITKGTQRMVSVSRGKMIEVKGRQLKLFLESKGSPMASSVDQLIWFCDQYNISPELLIGIAGVESSYGVHCYGHNPFGYLKAGAGTGLRTYNSWAEGYEAECKFIRSHWGGSRIERSSQLPGYCVPNHPWMENVERMKP